MGTRRGFLIWGLGAGPGSSQGGNAGVGSVVVCIPAGALSLFSTLPLDGSLGVNPLWNLEWSLIFIPDKMWPLP